MEENKQEKSREALLAEELILISAMVNDIMENVSIPFSQVYKVQELVKRTNLILDEANKKLEEKEVKEEGGHEKA